MRYWGYQEIKDSTGTLAGLLHSQNDYARNSRSNKNTATEIHRLLGTMVLRILHIGNTGARDIGIPGKYEIFVF